MKVFGNGGGEGLLLLYRCVGSDNHPLSLAGSWKSPRKRGRNNRLGNMHERTWNVPHVSAIRV